MVRLSSLLVNAPSVLLALALGCHAEEGPGTWGLDSSTSACPAPAAVQANGPCSAPHGTICKSDMHRLDCNGQPTGFVGCTCEQGGWTCDAQAPDCPDEGSEATAGEGGEGGDGSDGSEGGDATEAGLDDGPDATEASGGGGQG